MPLVMTCEKGNTRACTHTNSNVTISCLLYKGAALPIMHPLASKSPGMHPVHFARPPTAYYWDHAKIKNFLICLQLTIVPACDVCLLRYTRC